MDQGQIIKTQSIILLINDDFPAPDGAANIINFPLFNILNLFSHFFDQELGI